MNKLWKMWFEGWEVLVRMYWVVCLFGFALLPFTIILSVLALLEVLDIYMYITCFFMAMYSPIAAKWASGVSGQLQTKITMKTGDPTLDG